MYLTLLSVAPDLSAFVWKTTLDMTPYTHFAIMHRLYTDATGSDTVVSSGASGSANWTALLSGSGLSVPVAVTDGVHRFSFLPGSQQIGATVVSGALSFSGTVDLTKTAFVSLVSSPYVLYAYDKATGLVTGLADQSDVAMIIWELDLNHALVLIGAEKALAVAIRNHLQYSCEGRQELMDRYLELLSAQVRFNCADYAGANDLVLAGLSISITQCNCV